MNHTVLLNSNQIYCTICRKWEEIKMPIYIQDMVEKIKDFNLKHQKCKK